MTPVAPSAGVTAAQAEAFVDRLREARRVRVHDTANAGTNATEAPAAIRAREELERRRHESVLADLLARRAARHPDASERARAARLLQRIEQSSARHAQAEPAPSAPTPVTRVGPREAATPTHRQASSEQTAAAGQRQRIVITTDELRDHIQRFRVSARRARHQLLAGATTSEVVAPGGSGQTSARHASSVPAPQTAGEAQLERQRHANETQGATINRLTDMLAASNAAFEEQEAALRRGLDAAGRAVESEQREYDALYNESQELRCLLDKLKLEYERLANRPRGGEQDTLTQRVQVQCADQDDDEN